MSDNKQGMGASTPTLKFYGTTYSVWQCKLFGTDSLIYRPVDGEEPNWFHRKMQGLLLGHMWEKV